ncbi:MAG: polyribonucleotide nucleotidyltransferase [Dehalococcoidales bacterium]|nr:polyribonucleotide nucleotidyltransferase [Dehalococcoidales bacterium]
MITSSSFDCEVGGRKLIIDTGKLAGQASGAVTARYGDTVVLVTVCTSDKPREGIDFLPLTIDYEERLYAAGKIPGGFIRREGRPSQEATLASRLTDRPLRPLLPKAWRNDIQVVITVLSTDQENDPDILAVIGGSAALSISPIPFDGPVSAVHVGYINNELILNPTLAQLENSQLDLVVVSTKQAIVMLEAGANEAPEDITLKAIEFAHQANQDIIKLQEQLQQACGKPKLEAPASEVNPEALAAISPIVDDKLAQALSQPEKSLREQALNELKKELVESLGESFPEEDIIAAFETKVRAEIRGNLLDKKKRIDGRGLADIRPISCEVGLLPRTHGSALFTRGQTQVLAITTLGSIGKEQPLDGLGIEESKRFIHHYNFPPFSSGETKRIGSPGRREIGHGALVERAITPVLPKDEDFPYTIRLVSEVLSSSGSTSMASVCAASLSLMDAGIPTKAAVAGVAMGLVTGEKGDYIILTDIEGIEDNYGDMDFKIAGTAKGITAMQMDTKLTGISLEIVGKAINQAHQGRLSILETMQQTISSSRPELSQYAPRMYKITIDPDKIGAVIGTGGKTIRSIIEQTKASIDIDNDGTVIIGSPDEEAARKAIEIIEGLTKEVEVGATYTGKVTRLMDFGAFVEILPGKEGLVHISELADYRVAKVEDVVKVGDEVTVKVINIDEMGRVNLSRRAVFEKLSQVPGARVQDAPSKDYPFKKREVRPPQSKGGYHNRPNRGPSRGPRR